MKRCILLAGILALGITAVITSERRKVDVAASPAAALYLIADTEQELTRMPVRFTRMSDEEEIRIGDTLVRHYGSKLERKSEVETVEAYLAQVGNALAGRAHRRLPYKFHYIPNESMINAFALPGGHVFVGGGLLALMDSEDELAAVLGHEIEHIDHYHCAERAQQEQALRRIPLGGLVAIPITVFEAGYSKDQEMEADREGTRLAVQAGYSASGAIRLFEVFQRLYNQSQSRATNPQEELSQIAEQTLEGYFRSHPLPSERAAQIQRLIATENWPVRSERDLAVGYLFWTAQAQKMLKAKQYEQARHLAARSLKIQPGQLETQRVLAEAQFALADFAGAAATYRSMLENSSSNPELAGSYAMALAAADRRNGADEFRRWLESVGQALPRNAGVEQAGLSLVAGDPRPAAKLSAELHLSSDQWAPDSIGELGWWHYLAGNYTQAEQLLDEAVQRRPGRVNLWLQRSWTEIEVHRYSYALQSVDNGTWENSGAYRERLVGERAMAHAVAFWQANESDQAMGDFDRAVATQPEWRNPRWVQGLYSPLVAQSVEQMRAEQERRRKSRVAANR